MELQPDWPSSELSSELTRELRAAVTRWGVLVANVSVGTVCFALYGA